MRCLRGKQTNGKSYQKTIGQVGKKKGSERLETN